MNINQYNPSLIKRFWKQVVMFLFSLIMLLTFLGMIPTILFIYYNLYYFNAIKVLVGCVVLLVLIRANKAIQ